MQQKSVSFHIETIGFNAFEAEIIGISFSYEKGKGYFVSTENKEKAKNILEEFSPFFENNNIEKIGHELKFTIKILNTYNIQVKGLQGDWRTIDFNTVYKVRFDNKTYKVNGKIVNAEPPEKVWNEMKKNLIIMRIK